MMAVVVVTVLAMSGDQQYSCIAGVVWDVSDVVNNKQPGNKQQQQQQRPMDEL